MKQTGRKGRKEERSEERKKERNGRRIGQKCKETGKIVRNRKMEVSNKGKGKLNAMKREKKEVEEERHKH